MPFGIELIRLIEGGHWVHLDGQFGTGLLYPVSAAVAAGSAATLAVADVPRRQRTVKTAGVGACLILVALSSIFFADVAVAIRADNEFDTRSVTNRSLALFTITVVVGWRVRGAISSCETC
jgi:hypothetical protein